MSQTTRKPQEEMPSQPSQSTQWPTPKIGHGGEAEEPQGTEPSWGPGGELHLLRVTLCTSGSHVHIPSLTPHFSHTYAHTPGTLVENIGSGVRFGRVPALGSQARHLPSVCLSVGIWEMGITGPTPQLCGEN